MSRPDFKAEAVRLLNLARANGVAIIIEMQDGKKHSVDASGDMQQVINMQRHIGNHMAQALRGAVANPAQRRGYADAMKQAICDAIDMGLEGKDV